MVIVMPRLISSGVRSIRSNGTYRPPPRPAVAARAALKIRAAGANVRHRSDFDPPTEVHARDDGAHDRDCRLGVVINPLTALDRAKAFYSERCGFAVDVDHSAGDSFRVVQ